MSFAGDLEIFVRVVESGGFSTAARALGMTPSAVSKLVTRLEARLGAQLFRRTTRKLSLTQEGETFYRHGARIVAEGFMEPVRITQSVLAVLASYISHGEMEKVKHCLPKDLQSLWPETIPAM